MGYETHCNKVSARHTSSAHEKIDALLRRHPEHAEALYTKGLLLLETDPKGALWCFERGATLRSDDPDHPRGIERAIAALAAR